MQADVDQNTSTLPMIFILGNSHSGSTLLSFLLSFHPDIINLGELKVKTWLRDRTCSCGNPVATCVFYKDYFSEFNALKVAALEKIRLDNPSHFILLKKIKLDQPAIERLRSFYKSVSRRTTSIFPNAAYLTDSSKSIWLLNAWIQSIPPQDIRIIWIRRQTKANVASFVKRGSPFFSSLLSLLINDRITKGFLKRNKLEYLVVNYDRFYDAYAEEAKNISSFLGVEIPSVNEEYKNHHVISGNKGTRQAFTKQFSGLHEDKEWESILSPMQKTVLKWVS